MFSQLIQFLFWPNLVHFDLALFPNRGVAALLLEHDKWKKMLSSDVESSTPIRSLIVFMPGKHCYHYSLLKYTGLHYTACSALKWG